MNRKQQQTSHNLECISPTNLPAVQTALRYRRNRGCKDGTLAIQSYAFRLLDAFIGGKEFAHVSVHDLAAFVEDLRQRFAPQTAYTYCQALKANLRLALDVPALDDRLAEQLAIRSPHRGPKPGVLIRPDEFTAFLQACDAMYQRKNPRARVMMQCLLWLLRGTGFRIGELLALNCGHVRFDEHGAKLVLPDREEGLKTGPRTIYIHAAAPILKAWMAMHPDPQADAPLLIGIRDATGRKRLAYQTVGKQLHQFANRSGVNVGRDKPVTAHDFRHTLATEKVRDHQWTEAELRAYFGWHPAPPCQATTSTWPTATCATACCGTLEWMG